MAKYALPALAEVAVATAAGTAAGARLGLRNYESGRTRNRDNILERTSNEDAHESKHNPERPPAPVTVENVRPILNEDMTAQDMADIDNYADVALLRSELTRERSRLLDERARQKEVAEMEDIYENEPLLQQTGQDYYAAIQQREMQGDFPRALARAGWTARLIQSMRDRVIARLGNSQEARATIKRILVKRILPAAAGAAVTYGIGRVWPVSREAEGGIVAVSEDKKEEDAYYESGEMFRDNVRAPHASSRDFMRRYNDIDSQSGIAPLPGTVAGTASPDAPLGPIDDWLPKSSPLVPPSAPPERSGIPGARIFTERLEGDNLSERVGMPAAAVRRTTIPPPPAINSISPTQYYAGTEHRYVPEQVALPPSAGQGMKRKAADITTHQDRGMEAQIPQTYDTTNIPAIPAGVNANSSMQWKEYTAPYSGYNVPLTDAPNLVGIGFDAETAEREIAERAMGGENKEMPTPTPHPSMGAIPPIPPTLTGSDVNAANATNPSLRNVGKPRAVMGGEQPVPEVPNPQ
jgi:hypothetical protein